MTLDQIKANMRLADQFLEENMSDDVREILAEQKPCSLEDYYAGSVSQSVINDFESGNVRTIKLR
jgi:hypothetical protein